MAQKSYFSNEEALQYAKVLFHTIENNPSIAEKLAAYGFNQEEIAKGKELYLQAEELYAQNKASGHQERAAYTHFKEAVEQVNKAFSNYRAKAKLVFKNDGAAKEILGLNTKMKSAILPSLEDTIHFYKTLTEKEELMSGLYRLQVKKEDIKSQHQATLNTKELYSKYLQLKNSSEQSTKNKNEAFKALHKWTRNLYDYAKYALADQSQFLQAFGKPIQ